jgi:hypothetical protein
MLSFIDCEDMSDLKSNEITAIARHLHVPEIVAVEIGADLCRTLEGRGLLERLMLWPDRNTVGWLRRRG